MNTLFTRLPIVLLLFAAFFFPRTANATHIMGSDITYRCLGGNNYEIVVTIYRDCSGVAVPNSITVDVASTLCGNTTVVCNGLTADPNLWGADVSQLCPTALSTCQGGSLPGVQVYTYVGQFTLTPGCGLYTFSYEDCCRNSNDNLAQFQPGFRVEATLNSNAVTCDDAPEFSSLPVPYFCVGQVWNYSHGAVDADGDSLVYTLSAPLDWNGGGPLGYSGTFSPTNPMPTASGFAFDPQTGQMTFNPTTQGVYVVDVLVEEYRNGVLIGSTMRDIQIVIINCTNTSPIVNSCITTANSSGGAILDCNSLGVCPGSNLTFTITASDPDGQPLTVTSNIATAIPGATLTTTQIGGPDSISVLFQWTPNGLDTGFRYFTIQFADDACPIPGIQLFTYDISVLSGTYAGPDLFYCNGGGPVTITATGGNNFTWTPQNFIVGTSGPDSSFIQVAPATSTTYIVQSDLLGSCKTRDTVTVFNVNTFTTATSTTDDTICLNSSTIVAVQATPANQGPFTYSWTPASGVIQTPNNNITTVRPTAETTYLVTVVSSQGCIIRDSITIYINGVGPKVTVTPSADYVCPGDSVDLNTIVSALPCGAAVDPLNPCIPGSTFNLGATTPPGANSTTVTPYRGFWEGGRVQYLYTAAELQAIFGGATTITDMGFNVTAYGNQSEPYVNYTIRMACTNLTALSGTWANPGFTTVDGPANWVVTGTGLQTHNFDVPYNWDGFSNLLVEICYGQNADWNGYDGVETQTAFTGATMYFDADLSACGNNTVDGVSNQRPVTTFIGCTAPNSLYTYNWTASNGIAIPSVPTPRVQVSSPYSVTLIADDGTCQGDTTIFLHIDTTTLIEASNDTIICQGGTAQLNVTRLYPAPVICVADYDLTSIPYVAPVPDAGAVVSQGPVGDDATSSVALPFPFDFYCNTFNNAFYSTNGLVTFGVPDASFVSAPIPTPGTPNNFITAVWEDLINNGGTVTTYTNGVAPNRTQVFSWNNTPYLSGGGSVVSYVVLHEGTNEIDVLVGQANSIFFENNVMGIENGAGSAGVVPPGYAQGSWTVSTPVAFRFTPQNAGAQLQSLLWSPSVGLSSDTVASPTATPTGTTTYTVAATFSNGCITYDTVVVAIDTFNFSVVAVPDSICVGDTAQLNFIGAGVTYNWSPSGSLSASNVANPLAFPGVTTTYSVTATNAAGCLGVNTNTIVNVRTHPPVTLGPDQSTCPYDSVTLSPNGGPYVSYLWNTNATTPTITTGNQTASSQDYWVIVNDGNCTYSSDTTTIFEFTLPQLVTNPTGDTGVCIGNQITVYAAPGYPSYTWSNGSNASSITVTSGTSYYSYTAVDANGCVIASDSVHVVERPIPDPSFSTNDTLICQGQGTAILSVNNPVGGITYTWNPAGVGGANTGSTLTIDQPGSYTVTANDLGCTATGTLTVNGTTPPTVAIAGGDITTCDCDTTIGLVPVVTGGTLPVTYAWSNGSTDPSVVLTPSGSTSNSYSLTVTDNNNCTAATTNSTSIVTHCLTVEAYVADPVSGTIFNGQNAVLTVDNFSFNGTFSYVWTPAVSVNGDTTNKDLFIAGATQTQIYQVAVYDAVTGCTATDTTILAVVPPGTFATPNAFTPNGDGNNDYFYPVLPAGTSAAVQSLTIYNRWGQLVYSGNTAPGWNGEYNGVQQPAGTYLYYLTIVAPDPNNPSVNITYTIYGQLTLIN
jgi:gliding motility-associated-like protein